MNKSLTSVLEKTIDTKGSKLLVKDETLLREKLIDLLVFEAVFADNEEDKKEARLLIRKIAIAQSCPPSSIYSFYKAIGDGKIKQSFTVPAINVRMMTYDTAQIIFSLMQTHNSGPVVFEIARSEIEYTAQRPDEYAVVVLAAAIKEGYSGPVFLQGDHYQFSKNKFSKDQTQETEKIKSLIQESIKAAFYNIDIDASTLVDLSKTDLGQQQKTNYTVTEELTRYIRLLESKGTTIAIGAEIGHIGGKNSSKEDLIAFMQGYEKLLPKTQPGIGKISVQTGSSHGGLPDASGKLIDVNIDFSVLKDTGDAARSYGLAGVVQHGASTLPENLFSEFPKHKTLEIHLATGFQNIVYETMPEALRAKMHEWVLQNCRDEKEEGWSEQQFIYKCRKKAIGPFKKQLWQIHEKEKEPIRQALQKQFLFLFSKLNIVNQGHLQKAYA